MSTARQTTPFAPQTDTMHMSDRAEAAACNSRDESAGIASVLSPTPSKTVAYLMPRLSKASETFILHEILELERMGLRVEIFPLVHRDEHLVQPEAQALNERTHARSMFSKAMLAAQCHWLRKRPGAYLRAWWQAVRGNRSSRKFLLYTLGIVPEAALFARQMQTLGVEHVHAHWATHPTLAAYVIQQLTGLPYSFTAHAQDIYDERPMLEEKIRQASFVVTVSEYNRRLLCQLYGAEADDKMVVIYCGADPLKFQPQPSRQRTGAFTIVCVANLEEYKGHTYLVEACVALKAQGIPFRCLLVGDGEYRPHIAAQIARLGLTNHVSLLGHQPHSRVRAILADADVLVLPSVTTTSGNREAIPVALSEALATELPVVATAIGSISELVEHEHTGLLVPERNAYALAAALIRLQRDPALCKELGAAGRLKVLRDFNLHHNVAVLHSLMIHNWHPAPIPATRPMFASAASEG